MAKSPVTLGIEGIRTACTNQVSRLRAEKRIGARVLSRFLPNSGAFPPLATFPRGWAIDLTT